MKYKYWIKQYGETIEDAMTCCTNLDPSTLDHIAEEIAEEYFYEYDGWECSWPVIFTIADENNKHLGDVEVDREDRPVFKTIK